MASRQEKEVDHMAAIGVRFMYREKCSSQREREEVTPDGSILPQKETSCLLSEIEGSEFHLPTIILHEALFQWHSCTDVRVDSTNSSYVL